MLANELINGPLAAEIAPHIETGNDGAIAEILNRRDMTVKGRISAHDIKRYLTLYDLRLPIKKGASAACEAVSLALDEFLEFDLSEPVILAKFTAMLDALVADSTLSPVFSSRHKADLLALADVKTSRAEQLNVLVDNQAIAHALRG